MSLSKNPRQLAAGASGRTENSGGVQADETSVQRVTAILTDDTDKADDCKTNETHYVSPAIRRNNSEDLESDDYWRRVDAAIDQLKLDEFESMPANRCARLQGRLGSDTQHENPIIHKD